MLGEGCPLEFLSQVGVSDLYGEICRRRGRKEEVNVPAHTMAKKTVRI
jgi:hypothetical protein